MISGRLGRILSTRMILLASWFLTQPSNISHAQSPVVQKWSESRHGKSKPLSSLMANRPLILENAGPEIENRVRPLPIPSINRELGRPINRSPNASSQDGIGDLEVVTPGYFLGIGWDRKYRVRVSPPDTNGAVGQQEYVQWVNQAYAIFDKKTRDVKSVIDPGSGRPLQEIFDGNLLWQGFGGKCEFSNDGDPIVLYDKLATPPRWIMSQFAHSKPAGAPYSQCIAVSLTSDPGGEYSLYEFQFNNFNDYGKLGVWIDGYYAVFNMFEDDTPTSDFLGTKVCAFDRSRMLQGISASLQCVNLYAPQYGGILPADFDGTTSNAPPAGSPELFIGLDSSKLNLWKFQVNWDDNTKSQFERNPVEISVPAFDYPCVNGGFETSCILQPSSDTQRLQALGDRLMYRLSYRNLGNRQSLLLNHTVMVGNRTGIRWYEIDDPFRSASLRQQGTFAPNDGLFRWMGSIAMDKKGNILLEYSVSGDKTYPSWRYTGRRNDDALGQMRHEQNLVEGTGAQVNQQQRWITDRWGDYSAITLDPADDCTFWLTNQFQKNTGTYNWNTAITSIRFPDCT